LYNQTCNKDGTQPDEEIKPPGHKDTKGHKELVFLCALRLYGSKKFSPVVTQTESINLLIEY